MLYTILMCISHFMFFGSDILLAIYFIFILDQGNGVRQKVNSSDFLIEFKMGYKAAETTRNINSPFGPGNANEHTVQWQFKKFCKGDKSFEDEEHSGQSLEVDNDQLRASSKLILLQLNEKLPKNSTVTILRSFGAKWKGEKAQ